MTLRAVLFDVDFTLAKPGPDLGPEGYRRMGMRYGLELDPARYAGLCRQFAERGAATAREIAATLRRHDTTGRAG